MSKRVRAPTDAPDEWLATLEELLDESVQREEQLRLSAEDLTVEIPVAFNEDASRASWRFDGDLTVTVDGVRGSLAEWFRLHGETPPPPDNSEE